MYSDVDIRKHLGKHIGIFPLKEDNIQGSCVLLTASNLAWSVNSCASCVSNGKIKIAAHDTVIVLTDEVVYLGKKGFSVLSTTCIVIITPMNTEMIRMMPIESVPNFSISLGTCLRSILTLSVREKVFLIKMQYSPT